MSRVLILGGTGLLGQHAAQVLLANGHEPVLVGRRRPAEMLTGLAEVPMITLDVDSAADQQIAEALGQGESLIYALGPDDREIHQGSASAHFTKYLVERTARVARLARQAGVRRMVICGSYFSTWSRMHPEQEMPKGHIYVRARAEQARRAMELGGGQKAGGMDVCVLEIPYVFGTVPGQLPFWKDWLFERLRKMPIVLYPRGGTSVVSAAQVGQAAAGAALVGRHQARYPLADLQLDWPSLLKLILPEMGRAPRVITVPRILAEPAAYKMAWDLAREGKQAGVNPKRLMRDIMYREIFVDPSAARLELGLTSGGVPQAIAETVRACYPDRFMSHSKRG